MKMLLIDSLDVTAAIFALGFHQDPTQMLATHSLYANSVGVHFGLLSY